MASIGHFCVVQTYLLHFQWASSPEGILKRGMLVGEEPNSYSASPSSTIQSDSPSLLSLISSELGDLPGGVTQTSLLDSPDPLLSLSGWEGLFIVTVRQEVPRGT